MRFYNYLIEQSSPAETIWRDCQPFLKLARCHDIEGLKIGNFCEFARIDNRQKTSNFVKLSTNKNRAPQGTSRTLFPLFNDWLSSNGFVPRNIGVSASSGAFFGEEHGGDPRTIFPIGPVKFTYVKSKDFNVISDNPKLGWDMYALIWALREKVYKVEPSCIYLKDKNIHGKEAEKIAREHDVPLSISVAGFRTPDEDWVAKWDSRASNVKNFFGKSNLYEAYQKEYEIWFDCNEYYLVLNLH